MIEQPLPWDQVEENPEYQQLSAAEKRSTFNEWDHYSRQYAEENRLWDDDFQKEYENRANSILGDINKSTPWYEAVGGQTAVNSYNVGKNIINSFTSSWVQGDVALELQKKNPSLEYIAQQEKIIQSRPPSKEFQIFMDDKASAAETWNAFTSDPVGILGQLVAGSMGSNFRTMKEFGVTKALEIIPQGTVGGATIGSALPAVGTVAGGITGTAVGAQLALAEASMLSSHATEYAGTVIEAFQNAGVDVTDPEQLGAIIHDEEKMSKIRDLAQKKAVPVGVFDGISATLGNLFGPAGKIVGKPLTKITKRALEWAGESGIQGLLGSTGDVAGQVNAYGKVVSPKSALAEFIAEPVSSAVTEVAPSKAIDAVASLSPGNQAKVAKAKETTDKLRATGSPLTANAVANTTAEDVVDNATEEDKDVIHDLVDEDKEAVGVFKEDEDKVETPTTNEGAKDTVKAKSDLEVLAPRTAEVMKSEESKPTETVAAGNTITPTPTGVDPTTPVTPVTEKPAEKVVTEPTKPTTPTEYNVGDSVTLEDGTPGTVFAVHDNGNIVVKHGTGVEGKTAYKAVKPAEQNKVTLTKLAEQKAPVTPRTDQIGVATPEASPPGVVVAPPTTPATNAETAADALSVKENETVAPDVPYEAPRTTPVTAETATAEAGVSPEAATTEPVAPAAVEGQPAPTDNLPELEKAATEAKTALDAIGPEPRKPSNEKKFFGTRGRAEADPDVVAQYDRDVKAHAKWKRQYSKLKKTEVDTSNALFHARKARETVQAAPPVPTPVTPTTPPPRVAANQNTIDKINKLPANMQKKALKAVTVDESPDPYDDTTGQLGSHQKPLRPEENTNVINEAAKLGVLDDDATATSVMENIAKDKQSPPWVKMIANMILKIGLGGASIEAVYRPDSQWAALYVADGRILINTSARASSVAVNILHEAAHHVTFAKIRGAVKLNAVEKAAIKNLNNFFNKVKGMKEFADEYGIVNLEEFVAELFSSSSFRDRLALLNLKGDKISVWDRAVNYLAHIFFGRDVAHGSILQEAMANAMDLAGEPVVETSMTVAPKRQEYNTEIWRIPEQDLTSADTSINENKMPASFKIIQWIKGTLNADIGGGRFNNATEYLAAQNVKNVIYDPFNRDPAHNRNSARQIANGKSDTATINNVLNVIKESENRDLVIQQAADAVKDDGVAYFLIYEGGENIGKGGVETTKGWQERRAAETYVPEINKHFVNVTRKGNMLVASDPIKVTAAPKNGSVLSESMRWQDAITNPKASQAARTQAILSMVQDNTPAAPLNYEEMQRMSAPKVQEGVPLNPEQSKLVVNNLALAGFMAKKFGNIPRTSYDERNSEARLALINAAQTFDPSKGVPFAKYANFIIRRALQYMHRKSTVQSGREVSANAVIGGEEEEGGATLQDTIEDKQEGPTPDQGAIDIINEVKASLSDRDRKIWDDLGSGMTLREAGKVNNLSQEGVRKIFKRAGDQIKAALANAGITDIENIFPPIEQRIQATRAPAIRPEDEAIPPETVGPIEAADIEKAEMRQPSLADIPEPADGFYTLGDTLLVAPKVQTFHGTPHTIIGRILTKFIGSGEGHAAFGWGIYSAQAKGVAETYKDVGEPTIEVTLDGKRFEPHRIDQTAVLQNPESDDWAALQLYEDIENGLSPARAKERALEYFDKQINKFLDQGKQTLVEYYNQRYNAMVAFDTTKVQVSKNEGNLYTLDLDVEDDEVLDWDKPFDEQPKNIKKILEDAAKEKVLFLNGMTAREYLANKGIEDRLTPVKIIHAIQNADGNLEEARGALDDAYKNASPEANNSLKKAWNLVVNADIYFRDNVRGDRTGEQLYMLLVNKYGGKQEASEYLKSLGIPGLRFMDQFSRDRAEVESDVPQLERFLKDTKEKLAEWQEDIASGNTGGMSPQGLTNIIRGYERDIQDIQIRIEVAKEYKPSYNYVIFDDTKINITHKNGEHVGTAGELEGTTPMAAPKTQEGLKTKETWFSGQSFFNRNTSGAWKQSGKLLSAAGRWSKETYDMLKSSGFKAKAALKKIEFVTNRLKAAAKKEFTDQGFAIPTEAMNMVLAPMGNTYTPKQMEAIKDITRQGNRRLRDPNLSPADRKQIEVENETELLEFKATAREENISIGRAKAEAALLSLPTSIQEILTEMVEARKKLSERMIAEGNLSDSLNFTIDQNMDVYSHRSYSIFDGDEHAKFIRSDDPEALRIRNAADALFTKKARANAAREYGKSMRAAGTPVTKAQAIAATATADVSHEVAQMMNDYLRVADNGAIDAMRGKLPGQKNQSILTLKGDIPIEIRELWGEHKQADVNFARTYANMATFLAKNEFLTGVLDDGLSKGYLWKKGVSTGSIPLDFVPLFGDSSTAMGPLEGTYALPEVRDAFAEQNEKQNHEMISAAISALTLLSMKAKTAWDTASTIRNFAGNALFLAANGNFVRMFKHLKEGNIAFREVLNKTPKELEAYTVRLVELGILENNVRPEMMKELRSKLISDEGGNLLVRALKRLDEKTTDIYGSVDSFWKILDYESELSKLKEAIPGGNIAELEERAAGVVRKTLPTYSEAFKVSRQIFKGTLGQLVAPFITFTTEIMRVAGGTIHQSIIEIKDPNPAIRNIGIKRLVSTIATTSIIASIGLITKQLFDYDDEDEEAIRRALPEWQKNATLFFLPRGADGNPRYYDLSYLNPYNYFSDAANAALGAYSRKDGGILNAIGAAAGEFTRPFFAEQLFLGELNRLRYNRNSFGGEIYNPHDTAFDTTMKIGRDFFKQTMEPGIFERLINIGKGAYGYVERSGKQRNLGEEILGTFGQKVETLNVPQTLKFQASQFNRDRQNSARLFGTVYNTESTVSEGDIARAYINANAAEQADLQSLRDYILGAEQLGLKPHQVNQILAANNVGQESIKRARAGVYIKYTPSKSMLKEQNQKHPGRYQEFLKGYNQVPAKVELN